MPPKKRKFALMRLSNSIPIWAFLALMLQSCYQSKLPAKYQMPLPVGQKADRLFFMGRDTYLAHDESRKQLFLIKEGTVSDKQAYKAEVDFYHSVVGGNGHFYLVGMHHCQHYQVEDGKINGPLESYKVVNSEGNDYLSVFNFGVRVHEFESGYDYSFNRPVLPLICHNVLTGLFNRGEAEMYEYYLVDLETSEPLFFPEDVGYRDHQMRLDMRLPGRYFVQHGKVYVNYPSLNRCYVYQSDKHKLSYMDFPARTPDFSWYYYYDPTTGEEFLIKNLPYLQKEIYLWKDGEKGKEVLARFAAENFEIVDKQIYVEKFGKHYLIPFNALGQE
jgi:hypothetical protein